MKLTNNYKSFKLCKKSNDSYVMLYSPIIFIEVLCVVNIIYVIINVCNGTIDFSSVLCSDLMSLVGMAISVWTGISIFNAIENSKMVALDKKAQEAQESVDKLNKSIDEFLEQNANTYRLQFETELSINKDKIAEFIFSKISDTDIPLDSKPNIYYNMFILEHEYNKISNIANRSDINATQKKHLLGVYRQICNKLKSSCHLPEDKNLSFKDYFDYRITDSYFLEGYICGESDNYKEAYDKYTIAYNKYVTILNKIDFFEKIINPRIFNDDDFQIHIYSEIPSNEPEQICLCFICNLLGECNSKIVEAINILYTKNGGSFSEKEKQKGKLASALSLKYYKILFAILDDSEIEKREVYYRNYGCSRLRLAEFQWRISDSNNDKNAEEVFYYPTKIALKYFLKGEKLSKNRSKIYCMICRTLIQNIILKCHAFYIFQWLFLNGEHFSGDSLKNIRVDAWEMNTINYLISLLDNYYKMGTAKFPEKGDLNLYFILGMLLIKFIELKSMSNLFKNRLKVRLPTLEDLSEEMDYVKQCKLYSKSLYEKINYLLEEYKRLLSTDQKLTNR